MSFWRTLAGRPGSLNEREKSDPITRYLLRIVLAAAVAGLVCLWFYNRVHLFDEFQINRSVEKYDVEGTRYQRLGKRVIKYSHDGVFCVNTRNETIWSHAFSMQTPISDVCRGTMVIAEQRGDQVVVLNSKGIVGSFKTSLPILKAEVSAKGITALVLEDGDVTWINMYDTSGNEIAGIRTTMADSGYPLDIAMSRDAKRMMVSFVSSEGNELAGKISFYDFSAASASDDAHKAGEFVMNDVLSPDVFYTSSGIPVAVTDSGFKVFSTGKRPDERVSIEVDREIVSVFYDDSNLGFILRGSDAETKYDMVLYNWNGKTSMSADINFDYSYVGMDDGEIFLHDASRLYIYRLSGRPKLDITYENEVLHFSHLSGNRSYLVITPESMDHIRIE